MNSVQPEPAPSRARVQMPLPLVIEIIAGFMVESFRRMLSGHTVSNVH